MTIKHLETALQSCQTENYWIDFDPSRLGSFQILIDDIMDIFVMELQNDGSVVRATNNIEVLTNFLKCFPLAKIQELLAFDDAVQIRYNAYIDEHDNLVVKSVPHDHMTYPDAKLAVLEALEDLERVYNRAIVDNHHRLIQLQHGMEIIKKEILNRR
jgi:hypothetical protein